METTRCFLAIPINEELKEKIVEIQKKLALSGTDAKFVEKENFHFNLKFFGYLTNPEIEKISSVIENVIKNEKQFEIEISGIGTFPSPNSIRVVWLGISKGREQIVQLANNLENAFSKIGIEQENRPFEPHLTLCRIRSPKNIEALKKIIKEEQNINIGKMKISQIILYKSILSKKGPTYTELKKFILK